MITWTIVFPAPARLISMNDRLHWTEQRRRARAWRTATAWAARQQIHLPLPPCIVEIDLPVADRRARDPHNYFATVKPAVDGLVDAGLWPNDTPEYVTTVEPTLTPKADLVTITLIQREEPTAA